MHIGANNGITYTLINLYVGVHRTYKSMAQCCVHVYIFHFSHEFPFYLSLEPNPFTSNSSCTNELKNYFILFVTPLPPDNLYTTFRSYRLFEIFSVSVGEKYMHSLWLNCIYPKIIIRHDWYLVVYIYMTRLKSTKQETFAHVAIISLLGIGAASRGAISSFLRL